MQHPSPRTKTRGEDEILKHLLRLAATLAIIITILIPSSVWSMGLGVSPGKMEFSVRPGGTESQILQIINQSDSPSDFEVYVEGENAEWFKVTPGEFTLGANEVNEVEIVLSPPLTAEPQQYELSVCVISLPPGSDLRLGAGIKVPTQVQVTELPVMSIQWWVVSAVILVVVAAGITVWWKRKTSYV